MERDQLVVTQFNASDLRPGSYFWRIRATASSGQASDWSEPVKFIVTTQSANTIAVPVGNVSVVYLGGNVYIVRGVTSPGASVRISGREATATGDGLFQVQITAAPGMREVSIEAIDLQGNSRQYRFPVNGSG